MTHELELLEEGIRGNLVLDIVYATEHNFMNEVLYPKPLCFLQKDVKKALLNVASELEEMGLGIKVYDGYRPLSVQQKMWDKIQDPRFVSNPAVTGGKHTRGTAVDLTLIDREGNELKMPTPFDSFEDKAHSDYPDLPMEVLENRFLLRRIMKKHGFTHLDTEWWHYDFDNYQEYPSLDLSFDELLAPQFSA